MLVAGRLALLKEWAVELAGELRAALDRASSPTAIMQLRRLGLRPLLLTGDNEHTARAVAAEAGIGEVIAEVLPADKPQVVRQLQTPGRVVAMIGDGVSDAPALAQDDLGLAIGTGTRRRTRSGQTRRQVRTACNALVVERSLWQVFAISAPGRHRLLRVVETEN